MSNFAAPRTIVQGRKRIVSSCTACYTRKQKVPVQFLTGRKIGLAGTFTDAVIQCNRQSPCNHCISRRRTEQCIYISASQAETQAQAQAQTEIHALSRARAKARARPRVQNLEIGGSSEGVSPSAEKSGLTLACNESARTFRAPPLKSNVMTSLSEAFGYYKYSETNTLGLLGKVSHFTGRKLLSFNSYLAD